jgi:YD repeat-containing protein
VGGDDDDQLVALALDVVVAEDASDQRQITEQRHFRGGARVVLLDEAPDDERLIVLEMHGGLRIARTDLGDGTSIWLVKNEGWDSDNNMVFETDGRGYQTDYAYDANGNTIASAAPVQTTSEGTFRPTKLFDFDAYNNIVAYCDEHATHLAGGDWTSPPAPSDSRCATLAAGVPHTRTTYTYPGYQPYGELSTLSTPLGYTQHFSYAASQQAGNDYGLPTTVSGDSFTQIDGTTVTPTRTFWYDANGIARCYSSGNATTVISVDALGRNTSVADGDDSSANGVSICGKSGGQSGWNTQTTYSYFPTARCRTSRLRPSGPALCRSR